LENLEELYLSHNKIRKIEGLDVNVMIEQNSGEQDVTCPLFTTILEKVEGVGHLFEPNLED